MSTVCLRIVMQKQISRPHQQSTPAAVMWETLLLIVRAAAGAGADARRRVHLRRTEGLGQTRKRD